MHFEWDGAKAERNRRKHSVTFEDPDHSSGERRLITVGYSSRDRLLIVSHLESSETIRIISARPATAAERKRHET
jgi:hypothetical protein